MIDDEYLNRKLIAMMVTKLNSDFVISGEAENIRDGLKLITELKPEVVFLDIKMPDGSGFELLRKIPEITFEVVFITGFDEYALLAFEFNAIDYVLKPIDMTRLQLTLDKVSKSVKMRLTNPIDLKQVLLSGEVKEQIIAKIPVHHNNKVVLINAAEILYMQSSGGGTDLITQTNERFTSSRRLNDFEVTLRNFKNFLRVRKNIFINVNYVSSYSKGFSCYIIMANGMKIEIPRRKKSEILDLLSSNQPTG